MDLSKELKIESPPDVEAGQIPWETNGSRPARRWHWPTMPSFSRPLPAAPRLPERLFGLRKKTYLLILGGFLALLILAIGLGVGLGKKHNSTQNLPLPGNSQEYTGDLTYYEPGLGACGITSTPDQHIVAISHTVYDTKTPGGNPNANPLCGKKIRAQHTTASGQTRTIDLTVVDRCVGCKPNDLDTTEPTFGQLAPDGNGRTSVTWAWLD